MDMTTKIQAAVVRADMFICSAIHWMPVILPIAVALLLTFAAARMFGGGR